MCELLAISLPKAAKVNDMLAAFFSHGCDHPHGWGLAISTPHGQSLEKEPQDASRSTYLKGRLSGPIVTQQALAHIRYATKGPVAYENCHPFIASNADGRPWTLIHNGTVFDPGLLSPHLHSMQGQTDSEAILHYLLHILAQARTTNSARFQALAQAVAALSPRNKLNLIFSDGSFLYVHTNFLKQSLFTRSWNGGAVFSTRPLDDSSWHQVPLTQLLVYQDGEPVFASRPHDALYEEDPDEIRVLYQEYAML